MPATSTLSPGAVPLLVISAIGVVGELILLRHELVDCYPFKMLTYPPAHFYEQLGNLGSVAIFSITAFVALGLVRKTPLLLPPLTTVLAPLLYLAIVYGATSMFYGWTVPADTRNFDGYGIGEATSEFTQIAVGLIVGGLTLGSVCSGIISLATRRSRDA